ncbi:MAG: hypothetical protein SV422_09260 [Pseudomonadota bacterium]|nr:hypothetical protein [Pseudomonadota bacterium]
MARLLPFLPFLPFLPSLLCLSAFASADSSLLPTLPGARFDSAENPAAASSATFAAGFTSELGQAFGTQAIFNEPLRIRGYIRPEAGHVGDSADLFIVARIGDGFFMRANGGWAAWNGRVPDLQPWRSNVTLSEENTVDVFAGQIGAAGSYYVFLGYRTADGVLRYTPNAQQLDVAILATVNWQHDDAGWNVGGTPPDCPNPLLVTPVNLSRVTSILYPGQTRGGDFKPHGGFRFDGPGQTNAEPAIAAMSGTVYRGVRYLQGGELQYLFDIIHPCGMMLRYDHLRELSPKFAAIADTLPPATENTFTTLLSGYHVGAGEVVGTAIGFNGNVGVDFGVYDLRRPNGVTPARGGELAPYAICWFDELAPADAARVRDLPAGDFASGSASDYCH